jgi:hypothetical protein
MVSSIESVLFITISDYTCFASIQADHTATTNGDGIATANGHAHPSDQATTSSCSGGESPGVDPTEGEALTLSAVHLASVLSADLEDMPKGELSSESHVLNC